MKILKKNLACTNENLKRKMMLICTEEFKKKKFSSVEARTK